MQSSNTLELPHPSGLPMGSFILTCTTLFRISGSINAGKRSARHLPPYMTMKTFSFDPSKGKMSFSLDGSPGNALTASSLHHCNCQAILHLGSQEYGLFQMYFPLHVLYVAFCCHFCCSLV